jgi:sugar fermentation stimulation protein A
LKSKLFGRGFNSPRLHQTLQTALQQIYPHSVPLLFLEKKPLLAHNESMNISPELFDLNQLGEMSFAEFVSRPNRFVGEILQNGKKATCHISDTGRLKEILITGRRILVAKNPAHLKTDYRLIACELDEWVLINTSIHTYIARSAIRMGILGFVPETLQPEVKAGKSRLDFLVDNHLYIELKGTNLVVDSQCRFPDAPTTRGLRHVEELIQIKKKGKDAMILILGLRNCPCFIPNRHMDPDFSHLFQVALKSGVRYRGFRVKLDIRSGCVLFNGDLPLCQGISP